MGPTSRSLFPVVGLSALGRTFTDLGVSLSVGAGVEAALDVLSRSAAATRA
jgi:pyridoxamine---pyruvate transaminase